MANTEKADFAANIDVAKENIRGLFRDMKSLHTVPMEERENRLKQFIDRAKTYENDLALNKVEFMRLQNFEDPNAILVQIPQHCAKIVSKQHIVAHLEQLLAMHQCAMQQLWELNVKFS